ncbi:hypothetical protein HID58_017713 [Brassica napus]|uniref:Single-stranded DNA binding protein Ssb-like OB fold domain-containing protein n=1 Tax=Brassica napus TaxID=3708 RepID=A0ABQ8D7Y5_BRANA|nr:uncharacterized protein At4g28440-like [Brassica napus]KAH0925457.1 hypothetical protein HID58_017713 [Brassica napus]
MSSAPTASNTTDNSQQRPPRQRNGPPPPRRQGRNPPPQTRARYQQTNQGLQEKKKPVFVKVDQLKPGTSGHTLTVKVVDQNPVTQKPGAASSHLRPVRIAECLVGDETASILFTARNDQVDLMKPGTTVNLRNAKIDMFKGSMRLAVDKWGRIEVTEPADITVKEDNNLSLVEYELVNVE